MINYSTIPGGGGRTDGMTYSIVAYDSVGGSAGVAAATGGLAVGAFVPHARAGAGAIATQGASTNWLYGERGLGLLETGCTARETVDVLILDDPGRDYRQCLIVDGSAGIAAWTGKVCQPFTACRSALYRGVGVAAVGNRLTSPAVVDAMLESFAALQDTPLPERLLCALEAGEEAGGDLQGTLSAALRVDCFDLPPVDIRVDHSLRGALAELRDIKRRYASPPFKAFYDTVPTRRDYGRYRVST